MVDQPRAGVGVGSGIEVAIRFGGVDRADQSYGLIDLSPKGELFELIDGLLVAAILRVGG